ncbi:MAG TPA: AbrB/MazE/SpoVT family DNA-binding domain-containing protein [Clostridiaceae bacterium]|nr:AbrB/MazE/SpoVT family DNA-binding domain-containing protein [Clostridiaceae bacterium]
MRATGVVRRVDQLGRIVLPKKLRKEFEFNEKNDIELLIDGDTIVLRRFLPSCVFCNTRENVSEYKGRNICENCMEELKKL